MSNSETAPVETVSDKAASPVAPNEEQAKTDQPTQNIETKTEAKPEETKPVDKFAPKFAALSRKERELTKREKDAETRLKQREEELSAKEKAIQEREAKDLARQKLKKESPAKWLEEEGVSYEAVTQSILNNGDLTPAQKQEQILAAQQEQIQKLTERLENKEKKELEEKEASEASALEKQHQERIDSFKGEIKTFLTAAPDTYELLMNNPFDEDPIEAVYETVAAFYQEHKKVLDVKEAADMCEQFLESRVDKIAKLKKVSQKTLPPKEEPKSETAQSESPKTLENAHSSQTPNRQGRKLSDDELIAEASKHVRWLKQ